MSLLSRRRALMSAKDNILPYAYQRVEYIESTGTQYIQINKTMNNNSVFEIVASLTNLPLKASALFGSRTNASANNNNIGVALDPSLLAVDFNNSNYATYRTLINSYSINQKYIFYGDKNLRKISDENGTILSSNNTLCQDTINTSNVSLFKQTNQKSEWALASARVYSLKIYDSNVLSVNLIPCYRKSDNTIGMYDLVEGKFYTNAGTGEFIMGGNV